MSNQNYLPKTRYVAALLRLRGLIAKGIPLKAVDDTSPGNKSTTCTWGLCSGEKEAWPDAVDHLWPDEFLRRGRIAPKYIKNGMLCPIDRRDPTTSSELEMMQGCFHSCRIFKAKGKRPTQETVIQWYDQRIAEHAPKTSKAVSNGSV